MYSLLNVCRQSNDYRNPAFQAFAAEVAENLDPQKETDLSSRFFVIEKRKEKKKLLQCIYRILCIFTICITIKYN